MRRRNGAGCLLAALLAFTGACESPVETEPVPAISLSIVSGSGQTAAVGSELSQPLVVRVTTQRNKKTVGVPDQLVNFRIVTGEGSVFAGSALTDREGMAQDYWTLGPDIGENILEVRAVDPTTGEKLVFATFNAFGVVPGPEVCNGLDDNLDGTPDDASWVYCVSSAPAPNTDGKNSCSVDYLDLNAIVGDGCERLLGGRWTLTPRVTLSCPGFSFPILFNSGSISEFTLSTLSPTELGISADLDLGLTSIPLNNVIPVVLIPATESFTGSGQFDFSDVNLPVADADGSATISLAAAFTGPTSFEATLDLALDLTLTLPPIFFGAQQDGDCRDVHVTVIGTRVGS